MYHMSLFMSILSTMIACHLFMWISTNFQFINHNQKISMAVCVIFGIVASIFSYLSSSMGYGKYTMWELRMMAFSASYVVFPVLTWWFFNESILHPKTMVSILISIVLVSIQVLWK